MVKERLMQRWLDQGLTLDQAKKRLKDKILLTKSLTCKFLFHLINID